MVVVHCTAAIHTTYTRTHVQRDRTETKRARHTNINVKGDGSWTRSNLDSASASGWQVSTWINIVFLWSATSPVLSPPFPLPSFHPVSLALSLLFVPLSLSLSLSFSISLCLSIYVPLLPVCSPHRLFLVYNPGRVCTRFHGQRENYYPATLLRYLPCFLITIGAAAPTICVSRQLCVREPSVNVAAITMPGTLR